MKRFGFICIAMILLCSCGSTIKTEIPWNDARGDVCRVYSQYLDAMAARNIDEMFKYEDQMLWPSLKLDQYGQLRSLHKEFATLLAKSKVIFTECTNQKEWGIYGRKYDTAYMFTFKVEPPADVTEQEKVYADLFKNSTYTTAGVVINDHWKFVPAFGPEIFEIDQATKAYKEYLEAISKNDFNKIYEFTPVEMRTGITPKDIEKEWLIKGAQLPDIVKYGKPQPMIGKITFNPSFGTYTYDWGVLLDVAVDINSVSANIKKPDKQTDLLIEDYKQGNTSVLMVFEDGWKPITINPLFGAPGQEQQQ